MSTDRKFDPVTMEPRSEYLLHLAETLSAGVHQSREGEALRLLAEDYLTLRRPARKQSCVHGKGDPPMDCDWPYCGCDDNATRAMEIASNDTWDAAIKTFSNLPGDTPVLVSEIVSILQRAKELS